MSESEVQVEAAVQAAIEETGRKVWRPAGNRIRGVDRKRKCCLAVIAESGTGKSHLGRQLLQDPRYGKDRVQFICSEDASTTYGMDYNESRVSTFGQATAVVDEAIDAFHAGLPIPDLFFVDSFSGITDYELQEFIKNPKLSLKGNRDKIAEFGLLGEAGCEFMLKIRNELPTDSVILVTSNEGAFVTEPSLAVQGKVLPKNFRRWTDVCLHMKAEPGEVDPKTLKEEDGGIFLLNEAGVWERVDEPHISFGRNHRGVLDGSFIARYFYSQADGKVQAKGNHNLFMKEQAILPNVLAKIHGEAVN